MVHLSVTHSHARETWINEYGVFGMQGIEYRQLSDTCECMDIFSLFVNGQPSSGGISFLCFSIDMIFFTCIFCLAFSGYQQKVHWIR